MKYIRAVFLLISYELGFLHEGDFFKDINKSKISNNMCIFTG